MTDDADLVVVDASVVVALVASPARVSARLQERLGKASLHAPQHLPVEVDSALRGRLLGRHLTVAQADAARRSVAALPWELWPWELLCDRAWELRANLSTYDAGYVALAERLGAPLLTGDARLAAAPGIRCAVELFRD